MCYSGGVKKNSVASEHNLFHRLVVILMRVGYSCLWMPAGIYSLAIGFIISADTVGPLLPKALFEQMTFYSLKVPFMPVIKQEIFSKLDYWYTGSPGWWTIAVGLPLMCLGLSLILINFFNLHYALVSREYNRAHCPFCKES
jgi:hypothetical protein